MNELERKKSQISCLRISKDSESDTPGKVKLDSRVERVIQDAAETAPAMGARPI